MAETHLNDISKVYLDQVATEGTMDIKGFEIPKKERESAAERIKKKTAEKKAALEKKHGKKWMIIPSIQRRNMLMKQ